MTSPVAISSAAYRLVVPRCACSRASIRCALPGFIGSVALGAIQRLRSASSRPRTAPARLSAGRDTGRQASITFSISAGRGRTPRTSGPAGASSLSITPDPVDRRRRDPRRRGEPAHAPDRARPVRRRLVGLWRARAAPRHRRSAVGASTAVRHLTRPSNPRSTEITSPQPDRRQRHTDLRRDLRALVAPSAARNTIRARIACCCDADGVRNTVRNSRSSSSDSRSPQQHAPRSEPYRNFLPLNTRD